MYIYIYKDDPGAEPAEFQNHILANKAPQTQTFPAGHLQKPSDSVAEVQLHVAGARHFTFLRLHWFTKRVETGIFWFQRKVWICGFFVVRWPFQISTIEFALFLACVPESSTLGLCCKVNVTMLWGRSQLQRQFLTRPKVLETPASNMPVADGFIPHLL